MRDVVLLFERSCPNVAEARSNLARALSAAKLPASWREIDIEAPGAPPAWRTFGSPTILVDGEDVAGEAPAEGAACRLYEQQGRFVGAPSIDRIVARLRWQDPHSCGSDVRLALVALPGVAMALLPNVLCPACWPAYAGVLSLLGLTFLMQSWFLLPLTISFVAIATSVMVYRARVRRGYAPALLAGLAGVSLVFAKFVLASTAATYASTAVFVAATLWNGWPVRRAAPCRACAGP